MAKIPSADEYQRRLPVPVRYVTSQPNIHPAGLDTGAGMVEHAAGQLGGVLLQAGVDLHAIEKRRQDREDRAAVAEARTSLLQSQLNSVRSISESPDYGSYLSRYTDEMGKAKEEALKRVTNPEVRRVLSAEMDSTIARGSQQLYAKSLDMERSVGQGKLEDEIKRNLNLVSLANTDADRQAVINNVNSAIDVAVGDQYITAEEGAKQKRAFVAGYAETRLRSLPAKERLKLLSAPTKSFVEFIDPARRQAIQKATKEELKVEGYKEEGLALFNKAFKKYPDDYAKQQEFIRAAKVDARSQDDAMSRADRQYARDKQIERESRDAIAEDAMKWIQDDHLLADYPADKRRKIPAHDYALLKDIQNGIVSDKQWAYYNEHAAQWFSDPKSILSESLPTLHALVPKERLASVLDLYKKAAAGDQSSDVTEGRVNSLLSGIYRSTITNKRDQAEFRKDFELHRDMMTRELGRKPSYTELQQMSDKLLMDYTLHPRTLFGLHLSDYSAKRYWIEQHPLEAAAEIPEEERKALVARIQSRHPNVVPTAKDLVTLWLFMQDQKTKAQ